MQTGMIHPLKFCILNNHPQIISLASHEVEIQRFFITRLKIQENADIYLLIWKRLNSGFTSGSTLAASEELGVNVKRFGSIFVNSIFVLSSRFWAGC